MSKNLLDVAHVIECQKKASDFTYDLNFVASGINSYFLKTAVNEQLTGEEMLLLKTRISKLIDELGYILAK